MGYPSYSYVILAVQGLCLLHALKSRADQRWFFLLIFAPGLGAAIYLVAEILPKLRRGGMMTLDLPLFERMQVSGLEKRFRFSDTIDNRVALAEAYLNNGRLAEALALYRPVMDGPFKNNNYLLYGYARACFANAAYEESLSVLAAAERNPTSGKQRERKLLQAMALTRTTRPAEAEEAFKQAMIGFHGEEARCRYALFLWDHGRRAEAVTLFAKLLDDCGHSERDYRRREKAWIGLAKERIAEFRKQSAARKAA